MPVHIFSRGHSRDTTRKNLNRWSRHPSLCFSIDDRVAGPMAPPPPRLRTYSADPGAEACSGERPPAEACSGERPPAEACSVQRPPAEVSSERRAVMRPPGEVTESARICSYYSS